MHALIFLIIISLLLPLIVSGRRIAEAVESWSCRDNYLARHRYGAMTREICDSRCGQKLNCSGLQRDPEQICIETGFKGRIPRNNGGAFKSDVKYSRRYPAKIFANNQGPMVQKLVMGYTVGSYGVGLTHGGTVDYNNEKDIPGQNEVRFEVEGKTERITSVQWSLGVDGGGGTGLDGMITKVHFTTQLATYGPYGGKTGITTEGNKEFSNPGMELSYIESWSEEVNGKFGVTALNFGFCEPPVCFCAHPKLTKGGVEEHIEPLIDKDNTTCLTLLDQSVIVSAVQNTNIQENFGLFVYGRGLGYKRTDQNSLNTLRIKTRCGVTVKWQPCEIVEIRRAKSNGELDRVELFCEMQRYQEFQLQILNTNNDAKICELDFF